MTPLRRAVAVAFLFVAALHVGLLGRALHAAAYDTSVTDVALVAWHLALVLWVAVWLACVIPDTDPDLDAHGVADMWVAAQRNHGMTARIISAGAADRMNADPVPMMDVGRKSLNPTGRAYVELSHRGQVVALGMVER